MYVNVGMGWREAMSPAVGGRKHEGEGERASNRGPNAKVMIPGPVTCV